METTTKQGRVMDRRNFCRAQQRLGLWNAFLVSRGNVAVTLLKRLLMLAGISPVFFLLQVGRVVSWSGS